MRPEDDDPDRRDEDEDRRLPLRLPLSPLERTGEEVGLGEGLSWGAPSAGKMECIWI